MKVHMLGQDDATKQVQQILQIADVNNDGELSIDEFTHASVGRKNLMDEAKLRTAFKQLDTDDSGKVTIEELS